MVRVKIFAVTLSLILMLAGIATAQKRSRVKPKAAPAALATPTTVAPAKRLVTINLKQGAPVIGNFLRADAEMVQVEVHTERLAIRMTEIASLVFDTNAMTTAKTSDASPPVTPPAAAAASITELVPPPARTAYLALRRLADAAKLGLPYPQYVNLLIEVKPLVEEALAKLPETAIKNELATAMTAYVDAGQAWGTAQASGLLPLAIEPGATLKKKYEIKPGVNALGQEDHLRLDATLTTIWAMAAARLDNVAGLLQIR